MGDENDDFGVVSSRSENLNWEKIIEQDLRYKGRLDEKALTSNLISRLSEQGVFLTREYAPTASEADMRVYSFFDSRLSFHRHALKAKKLYAFWSFSDIEKESVALALQDTAALVGLTTTPNLGRLVSTNGDMQRSVCEVLIDLLKRNNPAFNPPYAPKMSGERNNENAE